jgi:hypothetical protein
MKKEHKPTPGKPSSNKPPLSKAALGRRAFLRTLGVGTVAAAASGPLVDQTHADTESNDEKRKARYQPNSAEVQTFYRVNRYPT